LLAGFAALAVAVLARRTAPGLGWSAVLGALLGLALGTHLMAVPFVAAVLWVVASDGRSWKGRIRTLAVAGGTATVVLIPYLGALARDGARIAHGRSVPLGAHLAATLEALTAPVRQVAGLGVGYFFDQDWTHFAEAVWARRCRWWVPAWPWSSERWHSSGSSSAVDRRWLRFAPWRGSGSGPGSPMRRSSACWRCHPSRITSSR
jgi:hypothetical protein